MSKGIILETVVKLTDSFSVLKYIFGHKSLFYDLQHRTNGHIESIGI